MESGFLEPKKKALMKKHSESLAKSLVEAKRENTQIALVLGGGIYIVERTNLSKN